MSLIQVSQSIVSASTLKVVIENCSNVSTSGPTNGHSDEDEPCSVIFSIRCSHPHIFYCLSGSSIEQVSATRESGSLDDSIPDMQAVSDRTWVHYGVPISSTSSPLPNSSRKQSSHVFRRPLLIAEDVADGLLRPGEKCVFYFSVDNCSIIQATEDSRSSEGDSLGQSDGVLRRRSALSQRSQVFSAIQRASPGSSAEDYSEYPSKKISAISTYSYHPDRPTFYVYYERLGNESGCVNHAREWMLHEKEKYVSWRDKYLDAVAKLEMGRRGPPMLRHRADSLLAESKLERSGSSSSSSFLTADAAPPPRRVCPPILGEGVRWRQQSASEVKAQRDPSSLNSHAIASLCYYYSGWRDCAESKPIVPYTSTRVHGSSKKASAMFSPKRTGGGTALCPLRGSIFRRTSCPNSPISHGLQGGQDDSRHSSAAGQSPRSSNNLRQVEEPRRAMVLSPVVHLSPREFPSNGKQDTPRLEPRLSISLTSPRSHNAVDKLAPGRGLALLLEQSEEKLAPLVGTTSRSFSGLPPSPSPAARSPRAAGESPTASTPSASRSSPPQAQTRVRSSEEQSPASKRVQGHARTATLDPSSAAALMDTGDHADNFSLSNGSLRLSSTMGSTHDVTPEQSSQLSGMNPEVYNAEKRPSYIQHSVDNVLQLFSIVSENLPSVMDVARCDTAATASPPHSLIPSSSAASITARRPVSLTNGCRTQLKLRSPSGNEALRQVDGIDKVKDRLVSVASSLQVEVWPYIEQASRLVLEHSPNAFTAVQSAVTDVLGSSRSATILRWIAMPLAAALVLQIMWVMFFESVDDTATMCVSSLREGLW